MQVRILGPLQVFDDGHEVDIGAASQRRLLARLAVASPETVPAERLAEDLSLSPGGLRTAISRLRKALGDTLVTQAPGYKLSADLDSTEFEAQLAQALQAEAAQRIAICDQALELWSGSPIAEFADEDWAQTESTRLEELRVLARETRVQAKLDLGRQAETVSELEALIADHPYRDEPRRQLMTALADSGRRTEALRTFQDYRQLLNDEVGTEPGTALWELDAEIASSQEQRESGERPQPSGALPAAITSFHGRDGDLEQITRELTENSIVTLTGVGGVGKTRLAIEVARQVGEVDWTSVCFVDLAKVTSEAAVLPATNSSLGIEATVDSATVARLIVGERLLLLIDNCEHVIDEAARLLEHLSASCPKLKILATSREGLGILGERIYAVAPLATDSGAVDLFVDRAQAVDRDFKLDETTSRAVTEICATLDGIPLAIELAAARVRSMSVSDIESRLDDRFRLLAGTRRTAVDRHSTLAAAVGWSFDLLEEDEQLALLWLSPFVGPFTLSDGEGLLQRSPVGDPASAVLSLADKSLLSRSADPPGSYRMLDTIRRYTFDRLPSLEEIARARQGHAHYILSEAKQAAEAMPGANSAWAARRLVGLDDDLVASVEWALNQGDVAFAVDLVSQLDGISQLEPATGPLARRVLEQEGADDCPGSLVLAAIELFDRYTSGGEVTADEGRQIIERRLAGERSRFAMQIAPWVITGSGNVEEGIEQSDRMWQLARKEGDLLAEAHVLGIRVYQRADPEPVAALERVLEFMEETQHAYLADVYYLLATAQAETDQELAIDRLKRAALVARSVHAPHQMTIALCRLCAESAKCGIRPDITSFTAQMLRGQRGLPHRQANFVAQRWLVYAVTLAGLEEWGAAATAVAICESQPATTSIRSREMVDESCKLIRELLLVETEFMATPPDEDLGSLALHMEDVILGHFPESPGRNGG